MTPCDPSWKSAWIHATNDARIAWWEFLVKKKKFCCQNAHYKYVLYTNVLHIYGKLFTTKFDTNVFYWYTVHSTQHHTVPFIIRHFYCCSYGITTTLKSWSSYVLCVSEAIQYKVHCSDVKTWTNFYWLFFICVIWLRSFLWFLRLPLFIGQTH